LSDGASPSVSVSELERRVRTAVRRAHGSVDGAFEAEVLGARTSDGARGTTFAVRCDAAHWRRLWSALTMASEWDEEGGRACAYDVLGVGASLQALATAERRDG